MKRRIILLFTVLVMSTVLLAACGGGGEQTAELPAVPSEYAGKTNPVGNQPDAVAAGQALYEERCSSCHGPEGKGDGPAAAALDPKPADLAVEVPNLTDDFVYWRIMDGGAMEPFNSSMPAQKGILSEDEVWQLVSYLRSLAN